MVAYILGMLEAVVLMGFVCLFVFFCDQCLCTCAMNMAKVCELSGFGAP